MRETRFQNRLSAISAQAREQNKSSFDEARMLFEEVAGEIQRQSESEREAEKRRSPFLKFLFGLVLLSVVCAISIGIYGVYNFPDAPVREVANGYAGKYGKPYAKEDFETFVLWKTALFASFGATFTLGFTFAFLETRQRRRHELSK